MPYSSVDELPKQVKSLPKGAQRIFMKAFNNAWNQYKDPDKRKGQASREEVSQKVGWSAVKKKYSKAGDEWKKQ